MTHTMNRRGALASLTVGAFLGGVRVGFAQAMTEQRFVVVMLRGGLDGMSVVVPYGDKHAAALRAPLLPSAPGTQGGMFDLGGFFGLHPAMSGLYDLFRSGQLLPVQAVAGPYRSRSHFEAQDLMEAGVDHRLPTGWLNRVAGLIPLRGPMDAAMAFGGGVPLVLRGPTQVTNWAPAVWPTPSQDLYARLIALHRHDPVTGPAFAEGLKERGFTESVMNGTAPPPNGSAFGVLAHRAGRMMEAKDGPRIATFDVEGWDTHGGQASVLGFGLRRLDEGLMTLRAALGEAWSKTVVLAITEFGRTAAINGSGGTDHGTASVALVLGGPVAGGRVLADWPGLAPNRLFENRDLQPTLDIRSVVKSILIGHLGLSIADTMAVFPDSAAVAPAAGVLRS